MEMEQQKFVDERRETVLQKLQSTLNSIKKDKPFLKESHAPAHAADDVFIQFLKGKSQEINSLKIDIASYHNEGQHFTKEYRTLEGHCSKLQRDFDKVDVFGRDDLASMRKKYLLQVNSMLQELAKKAHSNGIACKDCEVKN